MSLNNLTQDQLQAYLKFQMGKFNEWVWCFGMDTGINLREKFTDDELVHIFVMRYGAKLHEEYFGPDVKNPNHDFGDGFHRP